MTEPSIIAAEPPNPIVNELRTIMCQILRKRLEAFDAYGPWHHYFPELAPALPSCCHMLGIMMRE
ncbi:hypothetical protein O9993_09810 [Vibrio lentus]|nr:hypothetical protein [Vibrio lentus]